MSKLPNHYSAKLSDLDLRMVRAVPPGGNWKNIPDDVPSRRLEQIRRGYMNGKGSRSTYYGRLRADQPAYTISTCFNRPGNGCYIHYDVEGGQHRLISQREAARLQSFPDSFVFYGSRSAVYKQIGNAVPPLLAYQVAQALGCPGYFVDLFCGAGGLGLGFVWAGWSPVVAVDSDESAATTYSRNIHARVVVGDLTSPDTIRATVTAVWEVLGRRSGQRLFVIGGPPCQGFSTAGNRRSMSDERNRMFERFVEVLGHLRPDGFVFENVPGILNMQRGAVFRLILDAFKSAGYNLATWQLRAEEYGIPQRRTRVFVIGILAPGQPPEPPAPVTGRRTASTLFGELRRAISVAEAIGDLPPLQPGQDGSDLDYISPPTTPYQAFMRGQLDAAGYLRALGEAGAGHNARHS